LKIKRIFVLLLILIFSICGCSKNEPIDNSYISFESSFISSSEYVSESNSQVAIESSSQETVVESSSFVSSSTPSKNNPSSSSRPVSTSAATSSKVSSTSKPQTTVKPTYQILNYDNIKAMWLSQFDLKSIYTENAKQRPKSNYEKLIKTVLLNVKNNGFNTIFVQVRPYADSFYPSKIYPPSSYVVGAYGNSFSYDPFKILIDKAHELKLSVHAWINPLRAMTEGEIKKIPDTYKIKKWYNNKSNVLVNVDGRLYFNPAFYDVRKLIVDGVAEIISNYNVDGVHMDDYFYPTTAENFDSGIYSEYVDNGGDLTLDKFRKVRLNSLISEIYKKVKSKNGSLLFGISPQGNLEKAYNENYADVYTWCSKKGYIDYICPQVYFGLEHETHDFNKLSQEWQSIITNDNVNLLIGMSLGKAKAQIDHNAGTGKYEWAENTDVLKRCLENTKAFERCRGVAFFSYQYFYSPLTNIPESKTESERANFIPVLKNISWK